MRTMQNTQIRSVSTMQSFIMLRQVVYTVTGLLVVNQQGVSCKAYIYLSLEVLCWNFLEQTVQLCGRWMVSTCKWT